MTRYVSKPVKAIYRTAWDAEMPDDTSPQSITVHEDEIDTFTGLLDTNGNQLHRVLMPIGFCREEA